MATFFLIKDMSYVPKNSFTIGLDYHRLLNNGKLHGRGKLPTWLVQFLHAIVAFGFLKMAGKIWGMEKAMGFVLAHGFPIGDSVGCLTAGETKFGTIGTPVSGSPKQVGQFLLMFFARQANPTRQRRVDVL